MEQKQVTIQIRRQRGKTIEATFPVNGGGCEKDDFRADVQEEQQGGCLLGRFSLQLHTEPMCVGCNLEAEHPIRVLLPMPEKPEKITALYLFGDWWTRPAFADSFEEIPDRTQTALFRYPDRCGCFVPMIGRQFKTYLSGGTADALCLDMLAGMGGQSRVEEPLYLYAEGATAAEAVHKAFRWLAKHHNIRTREARRLPDLFHYLGWCSWDAFYTEVSEDKLRQKADELSGKHVPVKWMLIDDGWFAAKEKLLDGFHPDKAKFPQGFRPMIDDIRRKNGIRWFGVWHALGGYWDGIAPDSALVPQEAPYLYHAVNGKVIPSPRTGCGFYDDWYQLLNREGIEFVKVDGQSASPHYFENCIPLSEAARGLNRELEHGASRMDNAVINCMGMAMENVLTRPVSAVSRNSDDFFPQKEGCFTEHLLENAYNAIYHNEIYCCDWDMFWTQHPDAVKHSLLRAVSGGPVYFSDRVGKTVPEVLRPLAYTDGRLLMMDRSAKPTEDCIFTDPTKEGILKLQNTAPWGSVKAGGIAAYNLTCTAQTAGFSPAEIDGLEACSRYWVYDFFGRRAAAVERGGTYPVSLDADGFAWFVVLPYGSNGACLGLLEKYAGFSAVESVRTEANVQTIVLHESGTVGWLSERAPKKIHVNARDMTGSLLQRDTLFTLPLPTEAGATVISVSW